MRIVLHRIIALMALGIAAGMGILAAGQPGVSTSLDWSASPALLTVNTTDDSNDGSCDGTHCSLREAVRAASDRPGPDEILFDPSVFPAHEPSVIQLAAGLPAVHDGNTAIDASDAGVIVDGSALEGTDANGIVIQSSGNTLRDLQLTSIPGVAVVVGDFDGTGVHDNIVEGVTVLDSGFGSPGLGGRADGIWIVAYCQSCVASRNRIVGCTVEDGADDGIELWSESGGIVSSNLVVGNTVSGVAEVGIELDAHGPGGSVDGNTVAGNLVEGSVEQAGIVINAWQGGSASANVVNGNVVVDNADYGIGITSGGAGSTAGGNRIVFNIVERHDAEGIWISADDGASSDGNCIMGNTIRDHDQTVEGIGIRLYTNDNTVYRNNFIDNLCSASDDGQNNSWDHDGQGNYWSDYGGQDEDHDGIGDAPYPVAPNGADNFPLMAPYALDHTVYLPVVRGASP